MRISNWHYVYVLLSGSDNEMYIGYTNDLKRRIKEHNARSGFSTKHRLPLSLIYTESCLNKKDARRREGYLKTTQGRRFLKLRLKEFLNG